MACLSSVATQCGRQAGGTTLPQDCFLWRRRRGGGASPDQSMLLPDDDLFSILSEMENFLAQTFYFSADIRFACMNAEGMAARNRDEVLSG